MKRTAFSFTDDDLRQAALILRQRMLDSLPAPEECHYEASPELQEKIRRIMVKDRRRMTLRKLRSQAAVAALCVLMGVSVWLGTDTEARAALSLWVREVYENGVVYRFFNQTDAIGLPNYEITLPPEYCRKSDDILNDYIRVTTFTDGSRTLIFSYQRMTADTALHIISSDYTYEPVQIGETTGDFYLAAQDSDTNELIWADEDAEILFQISAWLGKDELIALAESVALR